MVIRVSQLSLGLDQGTGETRTGSRDPLHITVKVDPPGPRDMGVRHVDFDRLSIPSKGRTQLVQLQQAGRGTKVIYQRGTTERPLRRQCV